MASFRSRRTAHARGLIVGDWTATAVLAFFTLCVTGAFLLMGGSLWPWDLENDIPNGLGVYVNVLGPTAVGLLFPALVLVLFDIFREIFLVDTPPYSAAFERKRPVLHVLMNVGATHGGLVAVGKLGVQDDVALGLSVLMAILMICVMIALAMKVTYPATGVATQPSYKRAVLIGVFATFMIPTHMVLSYIDQQINVVTDHLLR